jgi:MFS family permease
MLALWGLASLVGGLVAGRFGPAPVPARRIAVLLAAMAAADALLIAATSIPVLIVGLICSGAQIAPLGAQIYNLIGVIAPEGAATESTTWLATGSIGGASLGSALGGTLIGAGGARAGYALAVAAALGALACVRGAVGHLRPREVIAGRERAARSASSLT